MKTPREILLSRHSHAEAKLDSIRQEVVHTVATAAKESREFAFAATVRGWFATAFCELVWRPRWIWSSLAAVWLMILGVNFHLSADVPRMVAKSAPNSAEFILTLREQERVLAELTGKSDSPDVIVPKREETQPRSEVASPTATI